MSVCPRIWTAALLAGVGLVACGEDDTTDEDRVTAAIERVATTADPANCTEVQTPRFVEQTVGDGKKGRAAVRQCRRNANRGVADRVEVSAIEIDGDRATAEAALTGGTFDGQTLILGLARHGDRWKLDEFADFAAFDRDKMIASYARDLRSEGGVPRRVAACVGRRLGELSDEQMQRLLLNSDPADIEKVFAPCE